MNEASIRGNNKISLDELRLLVTQTHENMRAFVASLDGRGGSSHLPNLVAAVDRIGTAFPRRPPNDPRYGAEWKALASGKRKNLDPGTVRYLCWEPRIATSDRFLAYLWSSGMKLTSRPIAGLVRSFHATWEAAPGGRPAAGVIKDLVKQYEGASPVVVKWKTNLNALFGVHGPENLGKGFVGAGKTLRSFLDEWYLDPQSPFTRETVEKATAICRDQFNRPTGPLLRMLIGELLPWSGWSMSALRKEIGALILTAASGQAREVLQKFVLIHRGLGDPRMPENEAKWAEVPHEARSRFEGWLEENPFALMERVYRQGKGWTWQRTGESAPYTARFEAK